LNDVGRLKTAYRLLYRSGLKQAEALERIEAELPSEHTRHLVEFIRKSERGICGEEVRSRGRQETEVGEDRLGVSR
jgi:UDP-N-acetylglucosamine acyltransferase